MKQWSDKKDPIHLQVANNKTLQECIVEETDDYFILSDGGITDCIYFACRIDKHTGEIYSSDKYENLVSDARKNDLTTELSYDNKLKKFRLTSLTDERKTKYIGINNNLFEARVDYSLTWDLDGNAGNQRIVSFTEVFSESIQSTSKKGNISLVSKDGAKGRGYLIYMPETAPIGTFIEGNIQITKTATEKPFIRNTIPNGIMKFMTGATELTHTFLIKGDGVIIFENDGFILKGEKIEKVLVYKGVLTEQEKQIELAKDIKLK